MGHSSPTLACPAWSGPARSARPGPRTRTARAPAEFSAARLSPAQPAQSGPVRPGSARRCTARHCRFGLARPGLPSSALPCSARSGLTSSARAALTWLGFAPPDPARCSAVRLGRTWPRLPSPSPPHPGRSPARPSVVRVGLVRFRSARSAYASAVLPRPARPWFDATLPPAQRGLVRGEAQAGSSRVGWLRSALTCSHQTCGPPAGPCSARLRPSQVTPACRVLRRQFGFT
jgi:hypothetical protein